MTEKLYYENTYLKSFDASVISCQKENNRYAIILDRTAFFPEGGGQSSDTGKIGCAAILDVQIHGDIIVHYTDIPFSTGEKVTCSIDWEKRFRKMQNHTGEHIVSGTINKHFGYNNVGFHLGSDGVTIDIDGELTDDEIRMTEMISNNAVAENIPVVSLFPSSDELEGMIYRSKLDITENVRIIKIGNYDSCACCAPHVANTGEIGIIKLLDYERYKGGVRIHMLCGYDALDDYNSKFYNISDIAVLLSVKQSETAEAVRRIFNELNEEKRVRNELKKELMSLKADLIEASEGNICIFEENADMNDLRAIVNKVIDKCGGICAAFSGNDKKGYQYVMAGKNVNMRDYARKINEALNGKGGGGIMIQGSVNSSAEFIKKYIAEEIFI